MMLSLSCGCSCAASTRSASRTMRTRSARSIEPELSSSSTRFSARPGCASRGGGLHREPQQIAILRERIARALRRKGQRRARRRLGIAIVERIDELLAAHRRRLRHLPFLEARRRELERHIADIEREGGERDSRSSRFPAAARARVARAFARGLVLLGDRFRRLAFFNSVATIVSTRSSCSSVLRTMSLLLDGM